MRGILTAIDLLDQNENLEMGLLHYIFGSIWFKAHIIDQKLRIHDMVKSDLNILTQPHLTVLFESLCKQWVQAEKFIPDARHVWLWRGKRLFYRHIRPFFGRVHLTSQWCQNTKGEKLWQNLLYNVDLQEIPQRMKIDIRLRRYRSVTLGCLRSHLKKDNSDLEQNETERYRNCHSNKRQSSLHKHIFMSMYIT